MKTIIIGLLTTPEECEEFLFNDIVDTCAVNNKKLSVYSILDKPDIQEIFLKMVETDPDVVVIVNLENTKDILDILCLGGNVFKVNEPPDISSGIRNQNVIKKEDNYYEVEVLSVELRNILDSIIL